MNPWIQLAQPQRPLLLDNNIIKTGNLTSQSKLDTKTFLQSLSPSFNKVNHNIMNENNNNNNNTYNGTENLSYYSPTSQNDNLIQQQQQQYQQPLQNQYQYQSQAQQQHPSHHQHHQQQQQQQQQRHNTQYQYQTPVQYQHQHNYQHQQTPQLYQLQYPYDQLQQQHQQHHQYVQTHTTQQPTYSDFSPKNNVTSIPNQSQFQTLQNSNQYKLPRIGNTKNDSDSWSNHSKYNSILEKNNDYNQNHTNNSSIATNNNSDDNNATNTNRDTINTNPNTTSNITIGTSSQNNSILNQESSQSIQTENEASLTPTSKSYLPNTGAADYKHYSANYGNNSLCTNRGSVSHITTTTTASNNNNNNNSTNNTNINVAKNNDSSYATIDAASSNNNSTNAAYSYDNQNIVTSTRPPHQSQHFYHPPQLATQNFLYPISVPIQYNNQHSQQQQQQQQNQPSTIYKDAYDNNNTNNIPNTLNNVQTHSNNGTDYNSVNNSTDYINNNKNTYINTPTQLLESKLNNELDHMGTFIHKCHLCEKSFMRKSWLKRHLLAHSTERHFLCPWCLSRHKRKDNLLQHIKLKHSKYLIEELKKTNCTFNWKTNSEEEKLILTKNDSVKTLLCQGVLNKEDVKKVINKLIEKGNHN